MALSDRIRQDAQKTGAEVVSSEAQELMQILNRLFYLPKDIDEETRFVHMVMTRGAETQERSGLHGSAILVGDAKWCLRQQVLSLVYRMEQGEQVSVGLKRIFEEGDSVHVKWQRLLIRGGYSKAEDLDFTRYDERTMLQYTPDIVCTIPEFHDGPMIGEIKSQNTFIYKKGKRHDSAWKQCQLYMHMTGIQKGFVLVEDKNSQEFRCEVYDYDPDSISQYLDRLDAVRDAYDNLMGERKMVRRKHDCAGPDCKRAAECPMRDACWNVGMGRVRL